MIGGLAATLSGAYIYMLIPVGLSPKFETGCSEAPKAHAAAVMEPRMEDRIL